MVEEFLVSRVGSVAKRWVGARYTMDGGKTWGTGDIDWDRETDTITITVYGPRATGGLDGRQCGGSSRRSGSPVQGGGDGAEKA